MQNRARFFLLGLALLCAGGCATQPQTVWHAEPQRISQVRTTAYTCTERGGRRNAIGHELSAGAVKSASADWSRWPLGTTFRIVGTNEVFRVDDYGSALVGTGTIDLYKIDRHAMAKWGVRVVDIDVLEWGSPGHSRAVLQTRARYRIAQAMIAGLTTSPNEQPSGDVAGF